MVPRSPAPQWDELQADPRYIEARRLVGTLRAD
jgi:hypothetical protein